MDRAVAAGAAALPAEYCRALQAHALAPLWTALHDLLPFERTTRAVPWLWRWREVRPLLLEAARLVSLEQAERRVLVLANPGLGGAYAATSTLYAGLQVIMPGEVAPSHRHTPAAIRLVLEGRGAFTTVEGVRCVMEPGDLILTPAGRWHDHGHRGPEPVVWLDGLDIPLVSAFEAAWCSKPSPPPPEVAETDPSTDEFTAAGLVPRRSRYPATGTPQVRWPWRVVRPALERLAAGAPPGQPVVLRYVDPTTGRPPLATMGCEVRWLRPGERSRPERRAASAVCHVIEGRGWSQVGAARLDWAAGDTFAVPPGHRVEHGNGSPAEPAVLFQFDDEPARRALGLWDEEAET
ncbi:MAG TPA: cupin domain-containing protein [Candidatus Binatia bacterium]|nr:cupin domain-containing protein [Candidatus Binatia bacterium]